MAKLQSHLWESANIQRGSIDSSNYKNYIFSVLFLKRLSEVYEDEFNAVKQDALNERSSEEEANAIASDPDEHQFIVPDIACWEYIKKRATDIGEHIMKAFYRLEGENTLLVGVLHLMDFNDKPRLWLPRLSRQFWAEV